MIQKMRATSLEVLHDLRDLVSWCQSNKEMNMILHPVEGDYICSKIDRLTNQEGIKEHFNQGVDEWFPILCGPDQVMIDAMMRVTVA